MGSRYGGLKQVDPVGPHGEILLEYSVFDAIQAGFERVVCVIRRDLEEAFDQHIASRLRGRIALDYAYQELTTSAMESGSWTNGPPSSDAMIRSSRKVRRASALRQYASR